MIEVVTGSSSLRTKRGIGVEDVQTTHDASVPRLVLFGGFLALIGWFIGIYMLWSSPTWSFRSKLAGTFLFPGGLFTGAAALWLARYTQHCSGGPGRVTTCSAEHVSISFVPQMPLSVWFPLIVVLVVVPLAVARHLERVRRASP
jgi:hypothetical protein